MSFFSSLLDYDAETKTKTIFHQTDEENYVIESKSDVTDLLEMNKAQYNDVDERARFGEKSWVVARIDLVTYYDLVRRGIADDKKKFSAWLRDPENRGYRTRPGRV